MSSVNPFLYTAGPVDFNLHLVKQNKRRRHYLVDFPAVSSSRYTGGEIAWGEYFEPAGKEHSPLVILLHGWGDHSVRPLKWMVAGLIKRGFSCFILYLPFHTSRLPINKTSLSQLTPDEWFTGYQMAVTDVRRIIDWADQNSRINNRQISVIALSLGAIVASIAMGIDPRIKASVLITHGGNTGKMMQTNSISRFGDKYRISEREYQKNQKNYADYLIDIAQKGFENVQPVERTYLIDPLTYASMIKGRPILMINALWDEIFPQDTSANFQKACGNCERFIFPAWHASIWIWYPSIVHRINKFLELVNHN